MVGFVALQVSMMVSFIQLWDIRLFFFFSLQDFNATRFCFLTRFQWHLFYSVMRFQLWLLLFGYEISMVGFQCQSVFSVLWFQTRSVLFLWSYTRFQRQSVLLRYEFSMMAGFIQLQDFIDICFIRLWDFFFSRFQCYLVLFPNEISMTSVIFGHEISIMVAFVWLRDLNDGRFSVSVFSVIQFQTRSVLFLCSFTWFQRQSVLFRCKFSMMVGFIRLQDFNDICFIQLWDFNYGCFFFFFRFFHYKISMPLGFVP